MRSSLWLLWAQEPRGKGAVMGLVVAAYPAPVLPCRPRRLTPTSAVRAGSSAPGGSFFSALATSSSFLRQGRTFQPFSWFSSLASLHDGASAYRLSGGCGSCIIPSGPHLPLIPSTLSPCRPFSYTFSFLTHPCVAECLGLLRSPVSIS